MYNKNFIIYSGYARSGKSTIINPCLEDLGYTILSTSKVLDNICNQITNNLVYTDFPISNDEADNFSFDLWREGIEGTINGRSFNRRSFKITVAEEICKPLFGQSIIPQQLVHTATTYLSFDTKIAIETIGGEEFNFLYQKLRNMGVRKGLPLLMNVRSHKEQPGVDIRELIPNVPEVYTMLDPLWMKEEMTDVIDNYENYVLK